MKNLSAVFWNEGLFLRPHHLQQQSRDHEDRLGAQLDLVNRFHWGIVALDIEKSALKNRVVEISRVHAVMPGGELAIVPENAQIEPRSFAEHLPEQGQPLEVFLALPRVRPRERNFAEEGHPGHELARYRVRTREIADEVSGDRVSPVQFAVANLRVLFGGEDRGAFECVKIAEVERKGADHFELSETFIPACIRIDAHRELERQCHRVRDELLAKARTLHGQKRSRADSDPGFVVRMVTINGFVGRLSHLLGSANVHPFALYTELASMAGAFSSFSQDGEAWSIPPYLHDDLAPSLREIVDRIGQYLSFVMPEKYRDVKLAWSAEGSMYKAAMPSDLLVEGNRFCLVVSGDEPVESLRTKVHATAKIGAPERIPALRNLALRGVAFRPLDAAPPEVPSRPAAYFHIDPVGPEWQKIGEDREIGVFLPGDGTLNVSLYVIVP